jgi:hypothetical protein
MAQGFAGVPGPDRWIHHEQITSAKGTLYEGATVVSGTPVEAVVVCAGASRGRVRFKSSAAGTLALLFLRPNAGVVPYEAGQPSTVSVTANTETLLTTDAIAGEARALIRFTPSGNGTVSTCDWMAL